MMILYGIAYLMGSLSFSILLAKWSKAKDPRTYGSGNPGATNIYRAGKRALALGVLLADALKAVPVLWWAGQQQLPLATLAWLGLIVVIGHAYPLYHRFQGGKGVATTLGVLFMISWPLALGALLVWGIIFGMTRIVSLASIIAASCLPWGVLFLGMKPLFAPMLCLAALIIYKHRPNIQRLAKGQEKSL